MPLFTVPYPLGIDYYIQELWQKPMYEKLISKWGLDDDKYNCFSRVYRNYNVNDKGYIPEAYKADANNTTHDYVGSDGLQSGPLFFQDTVAAISFFGLLDPIRTTHADVAQDTAKVELIFFVNLEQITAGGIPLNKQQGQRLDDVCVNDVVNWIKRRGGSTIEVIEQYRDIDKVLERYSGDYKKAVLNRDMQPFFCFKIICELRYNTLLYMKPTIPA